MNNKSVFVWRNLDGKCNCRLYLPRLHKIFKGDACRCLRCDTIYQITCFAGTCRFKRRSECWLKRKFKKYPEGIVNDDN